MPYIRVAPEVDAYYRPSPPQVLCLCGLSARPIAALVSSDKCLAIKTELLRHYTVSPTMSTEYLHFMYCRPLSNTHNANRRHTVVTSCHLEAIQASIQPPT